MSPNELLDTLVSVAGSRDPEVLLRCALDLALRLVSGRLGYAALGKPDAPSWSVTTADGPETQSVRARVSSALVSTALREGRCVVTTSADPRSVRARGVKAALCAPLGAADAPGVLYVEGAAGVRFSDADIRLVEGIARIAAHSTRSLLVRIDEDEGPTAPFRARLQASPLVGRSQALADTLERLLVVAPMDVPVLVLGPSGSGKTVLARVLHDSGPRAGAPFVQVDCAQAELSVASLAAEASGGTLLLDEPAQLPADVQTQLLAILDQDPVDVRIVAATRRDPRVLVEPLLQRLSRWEIRVPPLTQRRADIPMLARALGARFARQEDLEPLELSDGALDALVHRDWTGHVRELESAVMRAVLWALADGAAGVRRCHVVRSDEPPRAPEAPLSDDLAEAVKQFRRDHTDRVLRRCGGNKTAAAARLGVSRETLYKILRGE
jgi:Nif-specific regulatory protein